MAVPALVVANAPFKKYPGGVIALRCEDWLAGARGTLTTSVDTLSCSGSRVEDSQKATANIRTARFTAYAAADDTLTIPMAGIPIESVCSYQPFFSYRIVGEWDLTNAETLRASSQWRFGGVAALGFHGIDFLTDENNAEVGLHLTAIARAPHYVTETLGAGSIYEIDPGDTLTVRVFTQDGTTATWYLDQVILVPKFRSGAGHILQEFIRVPGNWQANTGADVTPVDGADGGDADGKFTWGYLFEDQVGNDSSFDFQDSDSEYDVRVTENDPEYPLYKSVAPTFTAKIEGSSHAYSLHCARYRPAGEITRDSFSRTIAPSTISGAGTEWGATTPEGYSWALNGTSAVLVTAEVDGSTGVQSIGTTTPSFIASQLGDGTNTGAKIRLSDFYSFSGTFLVGVNGAFLTDTDALVDVRVTAVVGNKTYVILFHAGNVDKGQWYFGYISGASPFGFVPILGPIDVTSWYIDGAIVGFRIEKSRYLVRARVWDASGAEPSTWDYEDFLNLTVAGVDVAYPYANNPRVAGNQAYGSGSFIVRTDTANFDAPSAIETHWDDIVVEYNPSGDPGDMNVSMEHPEGTEISQMIVPYGAAYFVYWGRYDWTTIGGGEPRLDFSSKVWNSAGAADMQRAEASFYIFRVFGVPLVPMNWRSSERKGAAWRFLLGSR